MSIPYKCTAILSKCYMMFIVQCEWCGGCALHVWLAVLGRGCMMLGSGDGAVSVKLTVHGPQQPSESIRVEKWNVI